MKSKDYPSDGDKLHSLLSRLVSLDVIGDDDADDNGNDGDNDKSNEETNPTLLPRSAGGLDCISSMFQADNRTTIKLPDETPK